jgi:hypothetical protein
MNSITGGREEKIVTQTQIVLQQKHGSDYESLRHRGAGARNICVGFADVMCASGVNLAHVTQMLRAKFAYDVRHAARVHHANVARTCRARSAQQGRLLIRCLYKYWRFLRMAYRNERDILNKTK